MKIEVGFNSGRFCPKPQYVKVTGKYYSRYKIQTVAYHQ